MMKQTGSNNNAPSLQIPFTLYDRIIATNNAIRKQYLQFFHDIIVFQEEFEQRLKVISYLNFLKGIKYDIKEDKNNIKEEKNEISDKSKKKTAQSKYKNIYGLVIGKVIKSINTFFQNCSDGNNENNERHIYISQELNYYFKHEKKDFQTYIQNFSQYCQNKRNKSIARNFLCKDVTNGLILVNLIIQFLDKDNPDFMHYTNKTSKLKITTTTVLKNDDSFHHVKNFFLDIQKELKNKNPTFDVYD